MFTWFSLINISLALLLFIFTVVIFVRNILIGKNGTDSGIINLGFIAVILVGMFCSLSVLLGQVSIDSLEALLRIGKSTNIEEVEVINNIVKVKNGNIISLIIGYGSLVGDYFILKFIKKMNIKECKKVKNRWDWSRVK